MSDRTRIALLLSGGGRTALNLIEHARDGRLPVEIVCALATRADCAGVQRLATAGIPPSIVARTAGVAMECLHAETDRILRAANVEMICLCGWLRHFRVADTDSSTDWSGRVLNIHPSLLPAFGGPGMHGLNVHDAVLRSGATESGCTVHFVDDLYDHGPTIVQRRVPVRPGDTREILAARVFVEELIAYPAAIRQVLAGGAEPAA